MDIKNVYMVRSAKGVDMLCVDDYLYHYDGHGRNNTFRWLCNRRKDKYTPCKSRITTTLATPGNPSVHIVRDVASQHTHERCSAHEITKVTERKRLANLHGEPCTLDYNRGRRPVEMIKQRRQKNAICSQPEMEDVCNMTADDHLELNDKERVNVLRRLDGRIMCCVDGQLYYLDGRSIKTSLHRWTCVRRRDVSCTALIYTVPTIMGSHRLYPSESDAHIHPHYSATKLIYMFQKHNISLIDDEQIKEVLRDCDVEELNGLAEGANETSSAHIRDEKFCVDEEPIIMEDEDYTDDEEQLTGLQDILAIEPDGVEESKVNKTKVEILPHGYEIVENYKTPSNYNPFEESNSTRFTFLPSAKGKKVLCLNRYLYHYDAQNKVNGNLFWTCIMRRSKAINCHVCVTMKVTEHGPIIESINGEHNHENATAEIKRRLLEMNIDNQESEYIEGKYVSSDDSTNYGNLEDDNIDWENNKQLTEKYVANLDSEIKKGLKLENPAMIVEYLSDGSNNISAKIEILPCALKEQSQVSDSNTTTTHMVTRSKLLKEQQIKQEQKNYSKVTGTSEGKNQTNLSKESKSKDSESIKDHKGINAQMNLTNICKLRSAKGSEMLCIDGYIYHAKNKGLISRSYWVCIKARDPEIKCKSRVSTAVQKDGSIRVLKIYNYHTHPINEDDIKRRLYNEINKKSNKKLKFRPLHFMEKSLDEINKEYGDLVIEHLRVSNISQDVIVHKPTRGSNINMRISPIGVAENDSMDTYDAMSVTQQSVIMNSSADEQTSSTTMHNNESLDENMWQEEVLEDGYPTPDNLIITEEDSIIEEIADTFEYDIESNCTMKLYAAPDGPPSLAVRMTLSALNLQYELINVDYCALEHRTEEYAKLNPQKQIPVLDDKGFYLSESVAIMQYLCDKYEPNSVLYPQNADVRAIINHRLCFNLSFYYTAISAHSMAPIFFNYERTEMTLKKVQNALEVFETYLQRSDSKYAAGDSLTIADFALIASTICLEAIHHDLTPYSAITRWYNNFKQEYPLLWEIANAGMQEIYEFEKNPPDLSHMHHPFHPTRK